VPQSQRGSVEVSVVFDSGPLAGVLKTSKMLSVKP
jgi:hypothetical protein